MFTGIIEKVGEVMDIRRTDSSSAITVATRFTDLQLGESVAVNGVCLTVTEFTSDGLARFFVSKETLDRSNLGQLTQGTRVNLERALTLSARLSGHIVQGHVDGLAKFVSAEAVTSSGSDEKSYQVTFELPGAFSRYLIEKGSIALNGVSLTLNSVVFDPSSDAIRIGIMLIPHTWTHTNLSNLQPGERVNFEVDLFAKYVESLCRNQLSHPRP